MSFDQFLNRMHAPAANDRLGQALVRLDASPYQAVVSSGDDDPTTQPDAWTAWADGGGAFGE